MALIKFYRGASGVTLPSYQDGAVFIVANGKQKDNLDLGDMYVDVPGSNQEGQRLHIVPNDAIYYKTQAEWELSGEWTQTSTENKIYVKIIIDGDKRTPYIAIGNGRTNVGLLTFRQLDATYTASDLIPASVQASSYAGTSQEYSRADHVHTLPLATVTQVLGLTPSAAAAKGVVTAVTSASEDLPTSKAVDAAISAAVSGISVPTGATNTDTPAMDGTASAGSQNRWARSDHVHPTDTSRAPKVHTGQTAGAYGGGTSELFGHVKLSDAIDSTASAADSIAASPKAVSSAITTLSASISAVASNVASVSDALTSATALIPAVGTTAAQNIATTSSAGTTSVGTPYAAWNHKHKITSSTITSALGFTPISSADKGVANGVATLDDTGKVPETQLPSYVDDIIEVASYSFLPASTDAESGKIYVTVDDNKTYRWSGTAFVEIASSLALGYTSSTAYPGDEGALNAAAIASLNSLAYKDSAEAFYQPAGTVTVVLPTASKNVVSSVSTGTVVTGVTTAAQTMVTSVTTAAQTVATGGTSTSVTVSGEILIIPESVITGIATASINKITAVGTASKNIVSSVSTGTVVTGVATAAQTMVTGQPTTSTFTGTETTISVS